MGSSTSPSASLSSSQSVSPSASFSTSSSWSPSSSPSPEPPYPVLPYVQGINIKHQLMREFLINTYKDGYSTHRTAETSFTRANGMKSVESYKGLNVFTVSYTKLLKGFGSGKMADTLWSFFLARLDALNEPFYLYNPSEWYPPDPTGAEARGRYLVCFKDPNAALNREYFSRCLSNMGVELVEVPVWPT